MLNKDRVDEINSTINIIQRLCESTGITLAARNHKGVLRVVVDDHVTGTTYVLARGEGPRNEK